jgi:hypothetical protein
MPAARMSAPFTKSEIPIKNQIEIILASPTYQKMMFKITKIATTTAAQKSGFW